MKPRKYIRLSSAEPFPVCGKPLDKEGPFYAPGSEWFTLFTDKNLLWKEGTAKALRNFGYTVTVEIVER